MGIAFGAYQVIGYIGEWALLNSLNGFGTRIAPRSRANCQTMPLSSAQVQDVPCSRVTPVARSILRGLVWQSSMAPWPSEDYWQ